MKCDVCDTTEGVEVFDPGGPEERRRCPAHAHLHELGAIAVPMSSPEEAARVFEALARGDLSVLSGLSGLSGGAAHPATHYRLDEGTSLSEQVSIDRGHLRALQILADRALANVVEGYQQTEETDAYLALFLRSRDGRGLESMLDGVREFYQFMLPRSGPPQHPANALAATIAMIGYLESVAETITEHNSLRHPRRDQGGVTA